MCSFGTHKPNLLAEINADRIAGLRSRTLSGQPDNAVRALMLSERLRNLEPRLRSSKAFFSSDFRLSTLAKRPPPWRWPGGTPHVGYVYWNGLSVSASQLLSLTQSGHGAGGPVSVFPTDFKLARC